MVEYASLATAASKMIPWQATISKQRGKGNVFKVKGSAFTKPGVNSRQGTWGEENKMQHGWCIDGKQGNKGRVTNKAG